MISSQDLFEAFVEDVRAGATIKQLVKTYGGGSIYIPSYKAFLRDEDLRKDYDDYRHKGLKDAEIVRLLSQEYDLSHGRVYNLTKALRVKWEPRLF